MSKTISINPDLFKISNRTRRKKESENAKPEIKIRNPPKAKTFRKNKILQFIRNQQEQNYKQLLGSSDNNNAPDPTKFNNDFDESLKYMMALTDSVEKPKSNAPKNQSLKQYSTNAQQNYENVFLDMPNELANIANVIVPSIQEPITRLSNPIHMEPKWGCLKNGVLPTYRNWQNKTQRVPVSERLHTQGPVLNVKNITGGNVEHNNVVDMNALTKQMILTSNKPDQKMIGGMYYPKQKRTIRRTYRVGKSKTKPNVTVLVSNRTIRNNITTKTHMFKQTPMEEVRRYLIKKGFIKVGSSAPNDVLRKMHETANLVCGEIQNHNPDNLLYNFLHSE